MMRTEAEIQIELDFHARNRELLDEECLVKKRKQKAAPEERTGKVEPSVQEDSNATYE